MAVVTATALLALNWRALAAHDLSRERVARMALIWIAIIATVAVLIRFVLP